MPTARTFLLLDGLGALVSAFSLAVLLVQWQAWIGMPTHMLYFLAIFPCLFALYDFYHYFNNKNSHLHLRNIAYANMSYCILSLGVALYGFKELTSWGWLYILMEVGVVLGLARMELKTVKK